MSTPAALRAAIDAETVEFRVGRRENAGASGGSAKAPLRIFMMDLWCYTPQYDRYLCEALKAENIEVTLGSVSPYQDPQYFVRIGLRNDPGLVDVVPKLRIGNDNLRRSLMLAESSINMTALLARFAVSKPDIVHVQWTPLLRKIPLELWFLCLVKKLNIKLVYTVHNVLPHDSGTRYASGFGRLYRKMDALICHNQEARKRLIGEFGVNPERVWVIPHGPLLHDEKQRSAKECRAWLSIPEHVTTVLCQGFIRSYKGLDFLLEGWRRVDTRGMKAQLIIAGTGEAELQRTIKEQISRLGIEESVRLDFRFISDEEVSAYYEAADVVVYPYREVTTSGALMTALAFGKTIVATTLPAFRETLRDGETALLVDYGDVEGLASALRRLIENPEERQCLAAAASSTQADDSWRHIAAETRTCYNAVLDGVRTGAFSA